MGRRVPAVVGPGGNSRDYLDVLALMEAAVAREERLALVCRAPL